MSVIAATTASDGGTGFSLSIMRPISGCAHALSRMPVLYSGAVHTYGTILSLMSAMLSVSFRLSGTRRGDAQPARQLPLRQLSANATISLVAFEKAS